ncbi:MAG: polyprenol monophosphomannose synthase [Ktedonobacterales bacterium]
MRIASSEQQSLNTWSVDEAAIGREDRVDTAQALRHPPRLSLVVPTRNERDNISLIANRVALVLGGINYELIFVDDSDDETPEMIVHVMATDLCVRMIHRDAAKRDGGLATAVVAGIHQAKGDFIGVIDGDLQHPPELLPTLLEAAEDADIVVASRYLPGGSSAGLDGLYRQIVSRGSRLAAATLFSRVRVCSDPMSGFFLFRREVVEGVELRPIGFKILLEVLVRGNWTRLSEIPYRFEERAVGESKASMEQGLAYLQHLRELRLHGPHGRGPVRYRYQRVTVGPDDPQPLDDDMPDDPEPAGPRRRHLLWLIGIMALALRLVLLPIGHWWDLTVDYNFFIDLAHNHSPYDTMAYLSHIARASGWDVNYEYYAYPPVPFYIYYPLAHIFALLHPTATYFIPVSGSYAMPNLPWDFYVLYKLPMWITDFVIAGLLARMSGTIRGWRDYLLNPYVLLVSAAWTFDAIMLLGLLLGAYYLQRGKFIQSGVALAFGTMVKFIPAIAAPVFVLYLIKRKRPVHEIVLFLAAYGVACLVFLGPFLQGLLYVTSFHGGRVGGGMNWEMYWRLWRFFPRGTNLDPVSMAIGAFGTPTLIIVLLLAYWYIFKSQEMHFNRMIIVALLAFFVGSKLVNEQYALVVFPFMFLEARRMGGAWRWFYRLFWIVPLAYAIMRVPIDRFLWLFYHTVFGSRADAIAVTGVTGLESPFIPWQNGYMDQVFVLVLGVGFFVLSIIALLWPIRAPVRPCRHAQLVTSTLPVEALAPRTPLAQGDVVSDMPEVLQQQPDAEKAPVLLDQASGDGARGGDTTPHQKVVVQR